MEILLILFYFQKKSVPYADQIQKKKEATEQTLKDLTNVILKEYNKPPSWLSRYFIFF